MGLTRSLKLIGQDCMRRQQDRLLGDRLWNLRRPDTTEGCSTGRTPLPWNALWPDIGVALLAFRASGHLMKL
jgi:hypothetical protein